MNTVNVFTDRNPLIFKLWVKEEKGSRELRLLTLLVDDVGTRDLWVAALLYCV